MTQMWICLFHGGCWMIFSFQEANRRGGISNGINEDQYLEESPEVCQSEQSSKPDTSGSRRVTQLL